MGMGQNKEGDENKFSMSQFVVYEGYACKVNSIYFSNPIKYSLYRIYDGERIYDAEESKLKAWDGKVK